MKRVYLHLGSNVGQRLANLEMGVQQLSAEAGKIVQRSSIYETEPWGLKGQDDFLNMVVAIDTKLRPESLLDLLKSIERNAGRDQGEKWGPRKLDIDILLFGDEVVDRKNLQIPHPEMAHRNFVLIPLMEVAGLSIHPVLNKSIEELYMESSDECEVWIHNEKE